MRKLFGLFLALLIAVPVWAAVGKVDFADGVFPDGKVAASFKAGEFTQLYARAKFSKKLGTLKFDKMDVILENVGGSGIYVGETLGRDSIGERWMNAAYMDFDIINAAGGSELKEPNEHKDLTLDELAGAPMREGFKQQVVMLTVNIFKITGYSRKAVWDDFDKAWVEKKTPIYDKGTTLAKGKVTIVQAESAVANGFQTKDGSFAIPYSDLVPKGYDINDFSTPVTVSGFRSTRDSDTAFPVGYSVQAFGVETAKLPESLRTIDGLKATLKEANVRNDMGWSYFVEGLRNMESGDVNITYSPVTIGGFPGERAIVLGNRGFAVIYLLQTATCTDVFWFDLNSPPFSLYETDIKNVIWSEKFTEQQRQAYLNAWDSVVGSVKILK